MALFIVEISDGQAIELKKKLKEKGSINSTPILRTVENMVAMVTTSIGDQIQEKLKLTPRLNADGTITVHTTFELNDLHRNLKGAFVYRSKNGGTIAFGRTTSAENAVELVALIQTSVLDGP